MQVAVNLIRIYMKYGVVSESVLTQMFTYLFEEYDHLSLNDQMSIFIYVTSMRSSTDYTNTWNDLNFPTDESGMPKHPSFI